MIDAKIKVCRKVIFIETAASGFSKHKYNLTIKIKGLNKKELKDIVEGKVSFTLTPRLHKHLT